MPGFGQRKEPSIYEASFPAITVSTGSVQSVGLEREETEGSENTYFELRFRPVWSGQARAVRSNIALKFEGNRLDWKLRTSWFPVDDGVWSGGFHLTVEENVYMAPGLKGSLSFLF